MYLIRTALAAIVAATLIATPAAAAQETTADPAAVAAEQARAAAEAAAGPRFQPRDGGYAGCVNEPPEAERIRATVPPGFSPQPGMNGGPGWQVSSPRGPVRAGETVRLGLRDKLGVTNRQVSTDVTRPDGKADRSPTWIFDDQWANASYPSSFIGAPPLVPGTYTVVWRDKATEAFIACDGFVVA